MEQYVPKNGTKLIFKKVFCIKNIVCVATILLDWMLPHSIKNPVTGLPQHARVSNFLVSFILNASDGTTTRRHSHLYETRN